jgi:hypothetical protein
MARPPFGQELSEAGRNLHRHSFTVAKNSYPPIQVIP